MKPEQRKYSSRIAVAAPAKTDSVKDDEIASLTMQEAHLQVTYSPPLDYKVLKNYNTIMLENIVGSLSLITSTLDNLEKKPFSLLHLKKKIILILSFKRNTVILACLIQLA